MPTHLNAMAQLQVATIPILGQDKNSVSLALNILNGIEDVPSDIDLYIEALQVLEDPVKREFFFKNDSFYAC